MGISLYFGGARIRRIGIGRPIVSGRVEHLHARPSRDIAPKQTNRRKTRAVAARRKHRAVYKVRLYAGRNRPGYWVRGDKSAPTAPRVNPRLPAAIGRPFPRMSPFPQLPRRSPMGTLCMLQLRIRSRSLLGLEEEANQASPRIPISKPRAQSAHARRIHL